MCERYHPDSVYNHWDPVLRSYRPYWEAPYYKREYYDPVLRCYRPYYPSSYPCASVCYDPIYPAYPSYSSRIYWDSRLCRYEPLCCDYKYYDPVSRLYRYSPYYYDKYSDYRLYCDRLALDRPYYRYDSIYRCERMWDPVCASYISACPSSAYVCAAYPCRTATEILADSRAADLAASAARVKAADLTASAARASRFASTACSSRQYAYSASPCKRLRESNCELSRHY